MQLFLKSTGTCVLQIEQDATGDTLRQLVEVRSQGMPSLPTLHEPSLADALLIFNLLADQDRVAQDCLLVVLLGPADRGQCNAGFCRNNGR